MQTPEELEAFIRLRLNRLRGRVCGFVEACDLDPRKEETIKSTFKSLSYDVENQIVDELYD